MSENASNDIYSDTHSTASTDAPAGAANTSDASTEGPAVAAVESALDDAERFGVLVSPDLTYKRLVFSDAAVAELLGTEEYAGSDAAFEQEGERFHAFYNPVAGAEQEPNPVASLARNTADTANPDFLQDPTRAIRGPVIFCAKEGGNLGEGTIADIEHSIRAVRNFRADHAEEYELWHNAVVNHEAVEEAEGAEGETP